jgi:hypothetical protein
MSSLMQFFITRLAKVQALGDAFGDASRLQPLVDAVHAIVAFVDFAGFLIPLGCSPGAGYDAAFAAYAQGLIHKNDTIRSALFHGSGGTGRHAPWFFAMKTWHIDIRHARQVVDYLGADWNNLGQPGADRQ